MKKLACLLGAAAMLTPAVATANQYDEQARRYLSNAIGSLGSGYSRDSDTQVGRLGDDATNSHTFTLQEGRSYRFIGACDNDCGDIDFWLYDGNGNEIDSDTLADDVPVVDVTPSWTGTFTLRVKMYECRIAPCSYAYVRLRR